MKTLKDYLNELIAGCSCEFGTKVSGGVHGDSMVCLACRDNKMPHAVEAMLNDHAKKIEELDKRLKLIEGDFYHTAANQIQELEEKMNKVIIKIGFDAMSTPCGGYCHQAKDCETFTCGCGCCG